MIIGYIRVSTSTQDSNNQKNTILNYCNDRKMFVDKFIDVQTSSRKSEKERKLEEIFQTIQKKDILIVTELSRLGRSVSEILNIVNKLIEQKVRLICIKENIDIEKNQTIQSKIMITMVSLFADLERDLISKRTKESLAAKKAMGIKLGRPPGPGKSKLEPLKEQIQEYLNKDISILNIARLLDVSYTTIYNFIKKNKMIKGSEKNKTLAEKQKIEKIKIYLNVENNAKGGRGIKRTIDDIKRFVFPGFDEDFHNLGHDTFILKVRYKNFEELDKTINNLIFEMYSHADMRNCHIEDTRIISMDRDNVSWG